MTLTDVRLGSDLVSLPRLQRVYERHGLKFFQKILTPDEMAYCLENHQKRFLERAGGRIATKEAVSKALGVGIKGLGWQKGLSWQSVELIAHTQQQPQLLLHDEAKSLAETLQVKGWRNTLSHDGDHVMATVIALI